MNMKMLQILFGFGLIVSWLFVMESIKHDVWNMIWSIKSTYDALIPSLIIMGMMFWFVVGCVSLITVVYDPMKVIEKSRVKIYKGEQSEECSTINNGSES